MSTLLKLLVSISKFFSIFSLIIGLLIILPFIAIFTYFSFQEYFNIGTLTLIEEYNDRDWKTLYDFEGHLGGDSKISQEKLKSFGYLGVYNEYNHISGDAKHDYIFFSSGTILKILSKWHIYRESSGFMDEGTNLDVYLVQDEYGRNWTTNDFIIDNPTILY